jgi:lipid-A-disaccharide synthase-like uncharacterized protein
MSVPNSVWLVLGMSGQLIFSARFLLQWIYSEYKQQSSIPLVFWYLSMIGGTALLCYAIHKQDPVFIVGQSFGVLIYWRNLQLRRQEARLANGAQSL